ncbi:hypothetical protein [Peribacillus asahii]|uniref:hypothetical protein n=1 Tax=Peribacillus asahii TaxID=228899 RepID=UPI00207A04B9|nr:hypothetical protein [Peribacillus asahii]USK83587.1 hypothetical protein LIT35_14110 [Peribacillus asahii]
MMAIILGILAIGVLIFFVSRTEKEEKIQRMNNLEQELVYILSYSRDITMAIYDMMENPDSEARFQQFKRLAMDNHQVVNNQRHQLQLTKNRNAPAEEIREASNLLDDFIAVRNIAFSSESCDEALNKLYGELKSIINAPFHGEPRANAVQIFNQLIGDIQNLGKDFRRTM